MNKVEYAEFQALKRSNEHQTREIAKLSAHIVEFERVLNRVSYDLADLQAYELPRRLDNHGSSLERLWNKQSTDFRDLNDDILNLTKLIDDNLLSEDEPDTCDCDDGECVVKDLADSMGILDLMTTIFDEGELKRVDEYIRTHKEPFNGDDLNRSLNKVVREVADAYLDSHLRPSNPKEFHFEVLVMPHEA